MSVEKHTGETSSQLNSTSIYGRRCKTPQCPHLSSHLCISSISVNLKIQKTAGRYDRSF